MVVLLEGLATLAPSQKDEAIAIEAYGFWGGGLNDCLLWGRRKVRRVEIPRDVYVRLRGVAVDAPSLGSSHSHHLPGSRFPRIIFRFYCVVKYLIYIIGDSLFYGGVPQRLPIELLGGSRLEAEM